MNELLCASPRCKPPTRHKPDCVQDPQQPCRGCLPARAADGLRLCQWETDRLAVHPPEAATLWIELGLSLVGGSGAGDGIGQKNPGRGLNLNPKVVEHRATIRHTLVSWTKLVCEERGFTPPPDSVEALGRFLANQARWLAAQDFAGEVADEIAALVETGRSLRQPSSTRIIEIGPCPRTTESDDEAEQTPCTGVLRALLRSEASLLPSAVQCDTQEDHCWDSTQWTKLGRNMPTMKKEKTLTSMPEPSALQARLVDELRTAAKKIRESADGCPPWPWKLNEDGDEVLAADGITVAEAFALSGRQQRAAANHMMTWHPGVAKLVAAWLECVAIGEEDGLPDSPSRARETSTALMIARAINGGTMQQMKTERMAA